MLAITMSFIFTPPLHANDPFAELDYEIEQLTADDSAEFEQWYVEHLKEFNQWQMAYLQQWDEEQASSLQQWGDANTASQEVVVVYNQQHDARTVIDLEKGEITINYTAQQAVLNTPSSEEQAQIVNQVIAENKQLWQDIGIDAPSEAQPQVVYVEPMAVENKTLQQVESEIRSQTQRQMSQLDIYADQNLTVVSEAKREQIVAEQKQVMKANEIKRIQTAQNTVRTQNIAYHDQPRSKVEYKVAISPSSLSKRATNYLPQIRKESAKRKLSPALVLAIMHTESHFNPKAKSHVPAYGLMQIVPTTAGHDVNKLYRGHDAPMRANDLYNPNINIETGTEYLKILHGRYLKGIKDPDSANYSVIAAYNTGSGNVAKAFGERRVSAAVAKINTMTSEQVYYHLINNLPYEETRNYLKKVNDRMQTYQDHTDTSI